MRKFRVGGLLGIALVLAACGGASTTETVTATSPTVTVSSGAQTVTVEAPAEAAAPETVTVSDTVEAEPITVTETVTVSKPAPKPRATRKRQRFTGNGGKVLALAVPRDSTLVWTNDGDLFTLYDEDMTVFVNSQGHRGDTFISAGRYKLSINAVGNWAIEIR